MVAMLRCQILGIAFLMADVVLGLKVPLYNYGGYSLPFGSKVTIQSVENSTPKTTSTKTEFNINQDAVAIMNPNSCFSVIILDDLSNYELT